MRVLVSGCSSGIGQAIVREMLGGGHQVVGLSRRQPEEEAGVEWIETDLTCPEDIDRAAAGIGPVDALVHAAGVMYTARLGDLDHELDRRMWQLHVEAPTRLLNALTAQQQALSRVVLIGSRTMTGAAGKSTYSASKAAMQGLVRSWAMELMAQQTTVNLVAPAATNTPMLHDPARVGVAPVCPPIGHFIDPEDIAALVAFLLGPYASAMTGQTLTVCGGASL
ncbi:NAD(P)-dependent dehydrogenase, short-chain alcohol dehydrogenase family [Kushneria avicenniae]|uniref:NAD(P)-dependent dehydrogenase, short-chain alcohol dehydrogenase family n=1 Tax=Kushneria avicenniae TaxID=402385 RepID=A0A1I1LYT6_9GAMM|nr:SDR family oxidoreductase [Kushneria avicenniae]SFC76098.1 NAD(P)-dependent dehydrogenase, short-chain alcohol dehydrogenase family [Kushneria avicenniae]